jgi:hypothetical protein
LSSAPREETDAPGVHSEPRAPELDGVTVVESGVVGQSAAEEAELGDEEDLEF